MPENLQGSERRTRQDEVESGARRELSQNGTQCTQPDLEIWVGEVEDGETPEGDERRRTDYAIKHFDRYVVWKYLSCGYFVHQ